MFLERERERERERETMNERERIEERRDRLNKSTIFLTNFNKKNYTIKYSNEEYNKFKNKKYKNNVEDLIK